MANEKSCGCGTCMGPTCGTISGLLALIAGALFLGSGLSMVSAMAASLYGGLALLLFGLSFTIHAMGMCPMCKKM